MLTARVGRRLAREDLRLGCAVALLGDQRQFQGGPDSWFAGPGAEPAGESIRLSDARPGVVDGPGQDALQHKIAADCYVADLDDENPMREFSLGFDKSL